MWKKISKDDSESIFENERYLFALLSPALIYIVALWRTFKMA